jgi:hypothetical protein
MIGDEHAAEGTIAEIALEAFHYFEMAGETTE